MKKLMLILLVLLLSGCASSPAWLDNRAACSVARDEAYVVSKWGPVAIGAKLAAADAAVMCKQ